MGKSKRINHRDSGRQTIEGTTDLEDVKEESINEKETPNPSPEINPTPETDHVSEERPSELRLKLESAILAMNEFLGDKKTPADATVEEMKEWQNLINEAQNLQRELTEKTEDLMHEAANIFRELRTQKTEKQETETIERPSIEKRPRTWKHILLDVDDNKITAKNLTSEDAKILWQGIAKNQDNPNAKIQKNIEDAKKLLDEYEEIQAAVKYQKEIKKDLNAGNRAARVEVGRTNGRSTKKETVTEEVRTNDPAAEKPIIPKTAEQESNGEPEEVYTTEYNAHDQERDEENPNSPGNARREINFSGSPLDIHNRAKLEQLLKEQGLTEEELNAEVERQMKFVQTEEVKNLFETIDKQKLATLLLSKLDLSVKNKANKETKIFEILRNIGLGDSNAENAPYDQKIQNIIDLQRQKVVEEVDREMAAERTQNSSWPKNLLKASGYVGIGLLFGVAGGGVGAGVGVALIRSGFNYLGNKKEEIKREELINKKITERLASEDLINQLLESFYTDTAIAKQRQINEVVLTSESSGAGETDATATGTDTKNIWQQFAENNPDKFSEYSTEEKEQLIKSLNALEAINRINDVREKDWIEKRLDAIGGRISGIELPDKIKKFFSFIELKGQDARFFGKEATPEAKAISAAAYTVAAALARQSAGVRNVFLGLAGWKVGGALADIMLTKKLDGGKAEIGRQTSAEEIIRQLDDLQNRREADLKLRNQQAIARLAMKTLGASAGFLSPAILEEIKNYVGSFNVPSVENAVADHSGHPTAESLDSAAGIASGSAEGEPIIAGTTKTPSEFDGIAGVADGPANSGGTEAVGTPAGSVEDILNQPSPKNFVEAVPPYDINQELSLNKPNDIPFVEAEAPYNVEDHIWPKGEHGIEETLKAGAATETAKATEAANPLTLALEKMSAVPGDKAKHLWGLIDAKAGAFVGELNVDLTKSEGRMTWVVDAIKDKIAENPEKFGLPKGINIDLLSKEQLTELAANESFNLELNNLLIDHNHGLIDAAANLKAEAVSNIEANNAFYAKVAPTLNADHPLGQADYNLMDKMHAAGEHVKQAASTVAEHAVEAGKTIPTPDHETVHESVEAIKNSASEVASQITAEAPSIITPEIAAKHAEFIRTLGDLNLNESQQSELSQYLAKSHLDLEKFGASEWSKLFLAFQEGNRDEMAKHLEGIFRQAGADNLYEGNNFNLIGITKTVDSFGGNQVIVFETPFPAGAEDASVLGSVKFQYDPLHNKLIALADGHRFGDNYGDNITPQNKLKLLLEDIRLKHNAKS